METPVLFHDPNQPESRRARRLLDRADIDYVTVHNDSAFEPGIPALHAPDLDSYTGLSGVKMYLWGRRVSDDNDIASHS